MHPLTPEAPAEASPKASSKAPARALMPDYLRLVALFGIVVVNVQFMAYPLGAGFMAADPLGAADRVAVWLVAGLATLKTYGLFSFMFGVGLRFQIQSARRRGVVLGPRYRNRMVGLVLLGACHGLLFFPGDILVLYGLLGSVLYLWRDWPTRRLVRVGAALLAVQVLVASALIVQPESVDPAWLAFAMQSNTAGSFLEVVVYRSVSFAFAFPFGLVFQGFSALGWFCLGYAAIRSGVLDRPGHPLWRRARRVCLGPGMALSLLGAWVVVYREAVWGDVLLVAAAPLATLGYLGVIAQVARPPGPRMAMILQAGGSSLSVYLGQSILLTTLLAPFGLGLWNAVSPVEAVALALGVTLVLIAGLILWRRAFALGPFEWILRRITGLGQP